MITYVYGHKLVQTCGACPEQYDVYDRDDNIIGYLRLRHGYFRAENTITDELVYEAYPKGDGFFINEDERHYHLTEAIKAITA